MIYKADLIKYLEKNAEKLSIKIIENDIYDSNNNNRLCTIDDYIEALRLKLGCSFTSIYYSHVMLENILKCNKCGTVIITREDEDYDPSFKCPTCTDYKTSFNYFTKEQIDSDENVKKLIDAYIYMDNFEKEAYEYEKEHGHPYYEVYKKKITTKNHMYTFELKCDDIRKSLFKGLHLRIFSYKKLDKPGLYTMSKCILIPLSFKMIYVHWIYPHLGKCHKDFRSKWYIGKAKEDKNIDMKE